ATCNRNGEGQLRTLGYAKKLMSTTYKDIFPPNYVILWEKRTLLYWEIARAVELSTKRTSRLKRTIGSAGVIGKISYTLVTAVLSTILWLQKLYLFIRYRQPVYPILLNKVKRLLTP
ncbi:MAG: hypothetical protein MN733_25440, partial [Nitrososphaera sp.]|nr:hypothetical protein [Nitrososphaera sp.]